MHLHEYQGYFDRRGPELAAEQPPTRRQRVAASSQPLGEFSLVGALTEQPPATPAQQPQVTERQL